MPIEQPWLERIFGRLYDTVTIPPGPFTNKIVMFGNPAGSYFNGRTRTLADTNMVRSFCLPVPMRFDAKRIRMEIVHHFSYCDDLEKFKKNCCLDFSISGKNYFSAPVSTVLLEDWIRVAIQRMGTNQAEQIGPYLDEALAKGTLGVSALEQGNFLIEHDQDFRVVVHAPDSFILVQPLIFRVFLEGPLYRSLN